MSRNYSLQTDAAMLGRLHDKLGQMSDKLSKSHFAAGVHGLQNAGRTGVSGLTNDTIDPVLHSITIEQEDFRMLRDIEAFDHFGSVYHYRVRTQVRSGVDLSLFEGGLPQQDQPNYTRAAEVMKTYAVRNSITHMASLITEGGGHAIDLEDELDTVAALQLSEILERDIYVGGDRYIDPVTGAFDFLDSATPANRARRMRGIQAQVREGNFAERGQPRDYAGYGNFQSVVGNRRGGFIDREFLDRFVTRVSNNGGQPRELHATAGQVQRFRASLFSLDRGSIGEHYSVRGSNITGRQDSSTSVETVQGPISVVTNRFKYDIATPIPVVGSSGTPPATPAGITTAAGAAVIGSGSRFEAADQYSYRIQAVNISGRGAASVSVIHTVGAGEDNLPVSVTIPNSPLAEEYFVFRSPKAAFQNGTVTAGSEMFVGKVRAQLGANTVFTDNGAIEPGLDSIILMPGDKRRAKLAKLGNLIHKLELGRLGLGDETAFAAYLACVVPAPRHFGLVDNVDQERVALEDDDFA